MTAADQAKRKLRHDLPLANAVLQSSLRAALSNFKAFRHPNFTQWSDLPNGLVIAAARVVLNRNDIYGDTPILCRADLVHGEREFTIDQLTAVLPRRRRAPLPKNSGRAELIEFHSDLQVPAFQLDVTFWDERGYGDSRCVGGVQVAEDAVSGVCAPE